MSRPREPYGCKGVDVMGVIPCDPSPPWVPRVPPRPRKATAWTPQGPQIGNPTLNLRSPGPPLGPTRPSSEFAVPRALPAPQDPQAGNPTFNLRSKGSPVGPIWVQQGPIKGCRERTLTGLPTLTRLLVPRMDSMGEGCSKSGALSATQMFERGRSTKVRILSERSQQKRGF